MHNKLIKITEYITIILAFLSMLVFASNLMNLFFIGFLSAWGLEIITRGKRQHIELPNKNNIQLYFLLTLALWMGISILWSENMERVDRLIELRIPILLVPLFAFLGMRKDFYFRKLLLTFAIGTIIYTIIILCYSYYKADTDPNQAIFHQNFLNIYNGCRHRTHLGLCQLFSIIILTYLKPQLIKHLKYTALYYIGFAFSYLLLMGAIYVSEGRMTLIIGFIISASFVFSFFWNRGLKLLVFCIMGIICISGFFILKNHPRMQNLQLSKEKLQQFDPRYEQWRCAKECIKESNFFIGTGMGDHTDLFNKIHAGKSYKRYFYPVESAHNQWLDGQIEYGLMGGILFMGIFISSFLGIKTRHEFAFIFNTSLMWFLFILIEPLFFRNTPIFLFCISLLSFYWAKKHQPTID